MKNSEKGKTGSKTWKKNEKKTLSEGKRGKQKKEESAMCSFHL